MLHAEIHDWIGWLDCRRYFILFLEGHACIIVPIRFFLLRAFTQVPQPGTLKLSHIQEGGYIFQLTVTDTAGQRSSDNVSVTILPMVHSAAGEKMAGAVASVTPRVWCSEQSKSLIKVKMLFSIFSVLFCPCSLHNDISFSFESLFQSEETSKHHLPVRAVILSGTEYLPFYC